MTDTTVVADASAPEEDPPRHDGLSGRARRSDYPMAAGVGVLVTVLGWLWRSEIVSTDPWHYVMAALNFPQKSWVPLGYTRYGMVLPVGPVAKVFGNAEVTYYFWPLLASGVLGASVFFLARRWWGTLAGLLAVALLVTNWVVFLNLSRYYPDIMSMALALAALSVAIVARGRQVADRAGTWVLVLIVGFLLGWSFEARETALFAWPPVIIVLLVRGRAVRNALLTALPVLAWAAVDLSISAIAYGDPLLKLHTFTRQDLATATNPADVAVLGQFVGKPRLSYLTMIPKLLTGPGAIPGGWWFLILGVLAICALLVRNAAVRLASLGFVASYILFVGISGMFLPHHPAGRIDIVRYWVQFVPWIALAVAGTVHVVAAGLGAHLPGRRAARASLAVVLGAAVLLGPLWTTVSAATRSPALAPNGGASLSAVRTELTTLRADRGTVWTDWQTARILPVYRRGPWGGAKVWTASIKSLTGPGSKPVDGDHVLLVRTKQSACGFCVAALQPWAKSHQQLPSSWHAVYTTPGGAYTLYSVGS